GVDGHDTGLSLIAVRAQRFNRQWPAVLLQGRRDRILEVEEDGVGGGLGGLGVESGLSSGNRQAGPPGSQHLPPRFSALGPRPASTYSLRLRIVRATSCGSWRSMIPKQSRTAKLAGS